MKEYYNAVYKVSILIIMIYASVHTERSSHLWFISYTHPRTHTPPQTPSASHLSPPHLTFFPSHLSQLPLKPLPTSHNTPSQSHANLIPLIPLKPLITLPIPPDFHPSGSRSRLSVESSAEKDVAKPFGPQMLKPTGPKPSKLWGIRAIRQHSSPFPVCLEYETILKNDRWHLHPA